MNLRETLLEKHSKTIATSVGLWIGTSKQRMDALVDLLLHDEPLVTQRAAWIIGFLTEKQIPLMQPHLPALISKMMQPGTHVALKRNLARIMQRMDIPESVHADVMNSSFELLADPKEAIAVRCFSMTVLLNLSKTYPELKQELRVIIEDALQHETSAGFRNRALKTMKEL